MKNDSNAVHGRHLESLANMFIGKFTSVDSIVAGLLEELEPFTGATSIRGGTDGLVPAPAVGDEVKFLCGDGTWSTVASGSCVLDTVCPSVNGGLWYEVVGSTPVVKIYYNGVEYPLGGGALEPTLTVAPSPLNVPVDGSASATISCDSGGNYLVTSLTEGVTAELVDNVITVNHVLGIEEASIKIRVMASSGFNAAEILLPVRMAVADPNLQVTLTSDSTINCNSSNATATVSYDAACTVEPTITPSPNVPYTYTGGVISVPYADIDGSVTFTVSLAKSPGFSTATKTFTVTMAKLDPQLTVTPSTLTVPFNDSVYADVSFNSNGSISLASSNSQITYNSSTQKIKADWALDGSTTITVNLSASTGYTAASTSFTVTMAEPETILTITPSAGATKGDTITATVSCNSGGSLSVDCDNSNIDWSWDGETITLPFHLFSQDTYVTVTASVTANGKYPAATKSFTFTYFGGTSTELNNLVTCMPFNNILSEDLCGNTWSVTGSPQIKNGVLNMFGECVFTTDVSASPANGVTANCWIYIVSGNESPNGAGLFYIYGYESDNNSPQTLADVRYDRKAGFIYACGGGIAAPVNQWFNLGFSFWQGNFRIFINGKSQANVHYAALSKYSSMSVQVGGNTTDFYMANFKVYVPVLHTGNFTCPTAPPLPTIA